MPKVGAVDPDACRYAGLHLKRMTYETRLLRLAAELEAPWANWFCYQEVDMCLCVFLFRQILESFRLTQGSGIRAGLLVGRPRIGQLIVKFWPSQRLFGRSGGSLNPRTQRSGLVRHKRSSRLPQYWCSVSFRLLLRFACEMRLKLLLYAGPVRSNRLRTTPTCVAWCHPERRSCYRLLFSGGQRRSARHSPRRAGRDPAIMGWWGVYFIYIGCKSRSKPPRAVHRLIGTGRQTGQISRLECGKEGHQARARRDHATAPWRGHGTTVWHLLGPLTVSDELQTRSRAAGAVLHAEPWLITSGQTRKLSPWCCQSIVARSEHLASWRAPNCRRSKATPRLFRPIEQSRAAT
jgi:hypothetical protein